MKISIVRIFLYSIALILLGMIFSTYFAPDMMIAITSLVWAMCGW